MIKTIVIRAVLNGWIVDVGCQTVVFQKLDEMLKELAAYYKEPVIVTDIYLKNSVNSGKVQDVPQAGQPSQNIANEYLREPQKVPNVPYR